MEQQESIIVQGAKVVGVAAIAAGVAGGVFGRVFESQRKPTAGEKLQSALSEVKTENGTSFFDTLNDASEKARTDFEKALKESKKRKKKSRKKSGDTDLQALAVSGITFSDYMRRAIMDSAERFGSNLQDALEQTTDSVAQNTQEQRKAAKKARKRARKEAMKRQEELEKQAAEGIERAQKQGGEALHVAEDRYHDIEKRTHDAVEKHLRPALARAGALTLASADEARQWLGQEAKQLEKRYEKARPQLEKRYAEVKPKLESSAERYVDVAGDLAKDVRKAVQEHAGDADKIAAELRKIAEERGEDVEKLLHEGSEHAREIAHDAGKNAKEGGKNAGSLLIWATIAGGLVYQVLLDDEQKQKARDVATSLFHEGRAMYADMQGQNGDFSV